MKTFETELMIGDSHVFKREPANSHDPFPIAIFDEKGRWLGYVPKEKNEVLARLMDNGRFIFGKLATKGWVNDWLKFGIRIFLRDF